MNLIKLVEQFSDEDACRQYLAELRWPDGPVCPRCECAKINGPSKRHLYECTDCGYQFSVKVGTVFNDSKLPLWKWFVATYLICESRKGISANQIKRTLGVSYKTAWYLCHRIRSALKDEGAALDGIVEVDETYIGGKVKGKPWHSNKTMVMGAIERGGRLIVEAQPNRSHGSIRSFVDEAVADGAEAIYTDEHKAYDGLGDADTIHDTVNHGRDEWVHGQVHTNTVESAWSLFDRAVLGSYHKLSAKHLQAYLDEFAFRFNNRENPFLFRDTLLKLVQGDVLTYEQLIA